MRQEPGTLFPSSPSLSSAFVGPPSQNRKIRTLRTGQNTTVLCGRAKLFKFKSYADGLTGFLNEPGCGPLFNGN